MLGLRFEDVDLRENQNRYFNFILYDYSYDMIKQNETII